MKRILWRLQTALFYLFTLLVALIPEQSATKMGRIIGHILFRLLKTRRRIAVDNIRQALPFMKRHPAFSCSLKSPNDIALETFEHLGLSIIEGGKIND